MSLALPMQTEFMRSQPMNNKYWSAVDTVNGIVKDGFPNNDFLHGHIDPSDGNYRGLHNVGDTRILLKDRPLDSAGHSSEIIRNNLDELKHRMDKDAHIINLLSYNKFSRAGHDVENARRQQHLSTFSAVKRGLDNVGDLSFNDSEELVDKRTFDMYRRYVARIAHFMQLRQQRREETRREEKKQFPLYRRYNTLDILASGLVGR